MFHLRKEQLAAFGAAARQRDLDQIRAHAREHFPDQLAALSDAEADQALSRMVTDAATLGLSRMDEVLLYVNLDLTLGEGFLRSPKHFWMRERLADASLPTLSERFRALYQEAAEREEQS